MSLHSNIYIPDININLFFPSRYAEYLRNHLIECVKSSIHQNNNVKSNACHRKERSTSSLFTFMKVFCARTCQYNEISVLQSNHRFNDDDLVPH